MFKISLDNLLRTLCATPLPDKYINLLDYMDAFREEKEVGAHPLFIRRLAVLDEERRQAKTSGQTMYYYKLAALGLAAKYVLGLPIERLPLGHEALFEAGAPQARDLALVWAAQFLAYCDGKEPFSIYNSEGSRVWSITDDNVEGQDFVEFFRIEA